jgi:hypothetical protein
MRRAVGGWILGCAAALSAFAATPAQAITNVYALQETLTAPSGTLLQYSVGAGGALMPLAPTPIPGPARDIAVTPDGRFAYVMTSITAVGSVGGSTIIPLIRAADGRLVPNGPAVGPMLLSSRGLIVNPQGTRVYYGHPTEAIFFRDINPDGTLGPEQSFSIGSGSEIITPYAQFFAMTPDGRNLYASQGGGASTIVWQATIDPATGAGVPKAPQRILSPGGAGEAPERVGRLAVSPTGSHLYLATDIPGAGIQRWAIDPATGALVGGTVEAPPTDGYAEGAVALSPGGGALWAPSTNGATSAPERIRQFSVAAGGMLLPLAPPAVAYVVASAGRDLIPSPDGVSLYLGQSGTVGEWSVGAGGTLTHRANLPAGADPGLDNRGIAISPSQAPVAAFSAIPAAAGAASFFDGRASSDPDGAIARYDWDFGDGATAPDGGPIVGHVYATAGTRTVTLTVTDADGTSTSQLWTGARMLRNGGPPARTTRSVAIPAAETAPAPRPHKGRSVTVRAERGTILVRVPGSRRYVRIEDLTEIPLGSIVDARKGRARITSEVDARTGRTQSALFYDWYFKILQTKGSKPITEARLTKGSFASCNRTRRTFSRSALAVAAQSKKRSKKRVRRLWGNGKGSFRTGGKRSSATVRGTHWLVEDRCDGTLTRVKQGRIDVRVFRTKKVVKLWKKKGKRFIYVAR